MLRPIAGLGISVLLSGCADALLSPSESRALATAEANWKARALTSYVFEYRHQCFCPPEDVQWMRISVQQGAVQQVVYADSTSVTHRDPERWPTIDVLFDQLHRTQDQSGGDLADVVAMFDIVDGYPTSVTFEAKADVLDGGSAYEIRSVEAIVDP